MKQGSIALMSMLIISAFTLILVVAMSETNLSTSYQYLNNVSNKSAYSIAESCLEESLVRLEADATFAGTTLVFDSNSQCVSVISGSSPKTIAITVVDSDYQQTFLGQAILTASGQAVNATLLDWKET